MSALGQADDAGWGESLKSLVFTPGIAVAKKTDAMQRQQYHQEILPCVPDLSRTALRLTRGTALADDLVQETLVRAWQARESFRPGTNARAWTQRILFNTYVNHYRKRRREHEALDQLRNWSARSQSDRHEDFGDEVTAALGDLSPEFREAVELVDLRDLSYQDAADHLDCPVGTVMSRLHRGRTRLRKALHGYAVDQGVVRDAA